MRSASALGLLALIIFAFAFWHEARHPPRMWNPREAEAPGWRARAIAGNIVAGARP